MGKSLRQLHYLEAIEEFIIDRRAAGMADATVQWYEYGLGLLADYLDDEGIDHVESLTPVGVRKYISRLRDEGRSKGGVAGVYRAARAFINWYWAEYRPDAESPVQGVTAPQSPRELQAPLSADDFNALLNACHGQRYEDVRDTAILYMLIDTGIRRQELADLNVGDVDMRDGSVLVRSGKGGKTRQVFIGPKTRKALAKYLRHRPGVTKDAPLWVTSKNGRITKSGLRQILRRRAAKAGIDEPSFHDFRRAFAVNALRSGMDLVTLQRLLGHSDLSVIERYLALASDDLQRSHSQHSPLEYMLQH